MTSTAVQTRPRQNAFDGRKGRKPESNLDQFVNLGLRAAGFRAHLDDRNEKLQAKIRDAQMQKIPYMLIVGGKEAEAGTVSVRHQSKGDLGPRPLAEFLSDLRKLVDSRSL